MQTSRWDRAKGIFHQALELPAADRLAFVEKECAGDAGLADEVRSLLDAFREDDTLLDEPAVARPRSKDPMVGRTVGAYRVVRRTARGGMGSVYLAVRADGQFQRRVALKVVRPEDCDAQLLERFETERQSLAVLDHPNIVRLVDAGVADDGVPYIVMDYVEGEPLDGYCAAQHLDIRARLELFRKICAAVHYAHQNLIVHRDLKPANILVTPDGAPKLLDFGIAKFLRQEAGGAMGLTQTQYQPLTPDFASPEQFAGRPVTTSSDIYSLGVILYRLLTTENPYGAPRTVADYERMVCETDPERPSSVGKRKGEILDPDLDTIVLIAMRKEPQLRYASADHLSQDIGRFLDGHALAASPQDWRYRAGKWIRRNRSAAAAMAATALVMIAATAISARYASEAHRQRLKAESRLEEVRGFAALMLELDDAARSGSTAARQAAVAKSLAKLNRLAAETDQNPAILAELAETYLRVGDLQGSPYQANLGDTAGAAASYAKALEIAGKLPTGSEPHLLARARLKASELQALTGDPRRALNGLRAALIVLNELAAAEPGNRAVARDRVAALNQLGLCLYQLDELEESLTHYHRARQFTPAAFGAEGLESRWWMARAEAKIGEIEARMGNRRGLERLEKAFAEFDAVQKMDPANPVLARSLAATGTVLGDLRPQAAAVEPLRRSLDALEGLTRRDPENRQYRRDYALAAAFLARLPGLNAGEPLRLSKASLDALADLAAQPEAPWYDHRNYAWFLLNTPHRELADPAAAARHAQAAVDQSQRRNPAALYTLALVRKAAGDKTAAAAIFEEALALVPTNDSHTRREIEEALRTVSGTASGR